MIDVTRTDFDTQFDLPDGRWIEIYDVRYDPGERGKTWGDPGECWPEVPSGVEFEALVGDSEDDSTIKRNATEAEAEEVYESVLRWAEAQQEVYA